MHSKYWEDYELGQAFSTPKMTVTETHLVFFAGLTGDFFPLHMNEEYSKKTEFGSRIVHGTLTFCLAVGLVGQTNIFANSLVVFLGADNLRLLAPVKPGDTIGVEVAISEKRQTSNPKKGITVMKYRVKNQRDEVVLTVDMIFLMYRRNQ